MARLIGGFHKSGYPQSSSIFFSDSALETIQLLGYPHGHGNPQLEKMIGIGSWGIFRQTYLLLLVLRLLRHGFGLGWCLPHRLVAQPRRIRHQPTRRSTVESVSPLFCNRNGHLPWLTCPRLDASNTVLTPWMCMALRIHG